MRRKRRGRHVFGRRASLLLAFASLGFGAEPHRRSSAETRTHTRCESCSRYSNGRIARSKAVRRAFQELHPCPATGASTGACPGYVADHIFPLWRGGADRVENLQWQMAEEARRKDRVE